MTESNLRHWKALERTDPAHTKPFDRGRFKGTATKPIWHERRLTEHFGPCGIGWGMDKPEFTLVPVGNELVVFCTVSLWYRDGEQIGTVYGVGGDKVLRIERNGPFVSDEAYKGAFTDALGNAMKHVGIGADIHMGLFDDSKYVRELREEFGEQTNVEAPARSLKTSDMPEQTGRDFAAAQRPASKLPPAVPRNPADQAPTVPRRDHPKRAQALEAWKRINGALIATDDPKLVGEIMAVNRLDMYVIREVNPPTFHDLIVLAKAKGWTAEAQELWQTVAA